MGLDGKVVQVDAAKNDAGVGRGRKEAEVRVDAGM